MRYAVLLLLAAAIAASLDSQARAAHWQADAVLWPEFISVSNDWAFHHGQVSDPGHLEKINTQDKQRYNVLCKKFEAWHQAMKQAGY
jgi:hypothetical protein